VRYQATPADLGRFRAAIIHRLGLQFDDARLGFLGEVLQRRLDKLGRSNPGYLQDLEEGQSSHEITALAGELTVGETYFFRNKEQFRALAEVVLPERMRIHRTPGVLRLLSAGCASGEEAYSIAIVVQEAMVDPSWKVLIRAVDLNPTVLEKAARARYSSWSLRDTPSDIQRKWFSVDDRELVLEDSVRAAVRFENGNLASDDPELWQPAAYDAIFCRNVLMYFSFEQMCAVIERISQSLAPGGFLFLGHAETLRGVSDAFHLRHSHETFYYELKEGSAPASRQPTQSPPRSIPRAAATMPVGGAWVDTIREATERVAALLPTPIAASSRDSSPALPWNLAPALDFLRLERFAEALDHVRAGPAAVEKDPDVLLLEAALLTHSGQLAAAEDACLRLLLIDELNAGAHYLLALCREQSGHKDRAREHDRVAAYLDPSFAMPRLHLGLLARSAGDRNAAGHELAQALPLLKREDASRLLLFGGGFGREALMALCEASLKECRSRP
jgi:chemotaxis protein methyltransferase CheR